MRSPWIGRLALIVTLATAGHGWAAPPSNDACADATPVTTFPFVATLDTSEATQAPTEPEVCNGGGGPTVWYDVTPSFTGQVCISTCGGTSYYTTVSAFAGSCALLGPPERCNDATCYYGSRIILDVVDGESHRIHIGMYGTFGSTTPGGPLRVVMADRKSVV